LVFIANNSRKKTKTMRNRLFPLFIFLTAFSMEVFSQEIVERIDSIANSYRQTFSGMAIMVIKDETVIYQKGFGYSDLEKKIQASADTRFNIGGLSRQITTLAILHLVENNSLGLDEKISSIIGFPEFGKDITVYQLLTHTSGLPSYMSLLEKGRTSPVTNQEVFDLLKAYGKTDFEPGTQHRISNSDYALLAMVIEKKSGMSFDRFVQRRVFRPMSIREQVVAQKKMNRIKNRAVGYVFRGNSGFVSNDPGVNTMIAGEAGIYLSLNEYKKVLSAMKGDMLLNETSRKLIFTPAKFSNGIEIWPHVVLGWAVGQEQNIKYYYQSGPNNAFTNYVMMIPDKELTIVLFSNQAGLFQLLDKIIYPIANLYTSDLFKQRIR
jgi:CubicO group peptidase (beta-lactamase class C family)